MVIGATDHHDEGITMATMGTVDKKL